MNPEQDLPEGLIWATRGRTWGFRFLLDGGLSDPLLEYERVFADLGDDLSACSRVTGKVALRFPDPLGRRDAAGRVIPHDFVVSGDVASNVQSVGDGLQQVWPLVEDAYARVWDAAGPPTTADLRFASQRDTPLDGSRSANGNGQAD
ncbi:MAG: hypothetical protein WD942_05375 [Dehalococcoidia bacterium]